MPHRWKWTLSDIALVSNAWPEKEAAALLKWAIWTADSLDYIGRVDDRAFGIKRRILYGHHPDVIDLAHVRWAAGTVVTAIDLCAAVLGRRYCSTKGHELALSSFFGKHGSKLVAKLPTDARAWVSAVNSDPDYQTVKRARNPMTHGRLIRTLQASTIKPGPHEQRTQFPVGPASSPLDARQLVKLSREVAVRHVESFVAGVTNALY